MELNKIYNMDAFDGMKQIPDKSVNLAIIDPPYNIGVTTQVNGKEILNQWDKIDNYQEWMRALLAEVARVLVDTGVVYLWHNDVPQITEILHNIKQDGNFAFRSFCIWDKGDGYRARSWHRRRVGGGSALRSWFNICEYCLHLFKIGGAAGGTGLERINSNPECYASLKEWYKRELRRLGIGITDIAEQYTKATGRKPYMLRHYFQDNQFEIPTQKVWEGVYVPLGFSKGYEELRQEYEGLRQEYEGLRQGYEGLRHPHFVDAMHCNVWHRPPLPPNNRLHTCQKPLDITERLIRVSSRKGDTVLDPFMGSATTAIAAMHEGRHFIGFENNAEYFAKAEKRIKEERAAAPSALPQHCRRQRQG